jgi:hypothetical protein
MKWSLLAVLGSGLVGGCHTDHTAPEPTSVYGRYVLRTMNGKPVPEVFSTSPTLRLEFMHGAVTLHPNHVFFDSTEIRRTEGTLVRRVIDVAQGTFVQTGALISLTSTRGERYSMTFDQRTLTQNLGGSVLLYRR